MEFNFSVYNFIEMLEIYGLDICLIYIAPLLVFSQRELVWSAAVFQSKNKSVIGLNFLKLIVECISLYITFGMHCSCYKYMYRRKFHCCT